MTMTIEGMIFVKPSEYRSDSVAVTSAVIAPASHNHTSHRLPGTDFLYRGQRAVPVEVTCCHTTAKIGDERPTRRGRGRRADPAGDPPTGGYCTSMPRWTGTAPLSCAPDGRSRPRRLCACRSGAGAGAGLTGVASSV